MFKGFGLQVCVFRDESRSEAPKTLNKTQTLNMDPDILSPKP